MADRKEQAGERLVTFEVLGQEFPLYTSAPEDEVQEILQLVKSYFEKHMNSSSRFISEKVAILICLNMAGEYVRLRREYEGYKRTSHENVNRLVKRIESYLELI